MAVVGAGISGLFASRALADHALRVRVFEKSRGTGGRMATRRERDRSFDSGAQYFTVRAPRFRRHVDSWVKGGLVRRWDGRIGEIGPGERIPRERNVERFVGVPGMTSVTRHLAEDLDVVFEVMVARVERLGAGWSLRSERDVDLGTYEAVILAVPPAQAAALLGDARGLARMAAAVRCAPCWAVLVAFGNDPALPYDGAFVRGSPLSWIARNSSKPGRSDVGSWVLHASPSWSREHLEESREEVGKRLVKAFFELTGEGTEDPIWMRAHRWRFALAEDPLEVGCLWDPQLGIGACGDWCQGSRVEGAALSGLVMADRVLDRSPGPDPEPAGR